MDAEADIALEAQRVLLEALLGLYHSILEQWIRQFVLYEFSEAFPLIGPVLAPSRIGLQKRPKCAKNHPYRLAKLFRTFATHGQSFP